MTKRIGITEYLETIHSEMEQMSYEVVAANRLAIIQSICNFNVFWLCSISDIIMKPSTIDFIHDNVYNFNRKLSIGEMMNADFIISNLRPKSWSEFEIMFEIYKPELLNNLKKKSNEYFRSRSINAKAHVYKQRLLQED